MKSMWGIHTRDEQLFLQKSLIAMGWHEMGNLSEIRPSRDAFKEEYSKVYPDSTKQSVANCAGMLYRFVVETKPGDYVIFPSSFNRMVNIGEVTGSYYYDESALDGLYDYTHRRNVKWIKSVPRTAFSQQALYAIAAQMTYFSIREDCVDEFQRALDSEFPKTPQNEFFDDTISTTSKEIRENTKDFIIKALMKNLKGYPLEDFVANLLNAMGYHTTVSSKGGDRGIDIVAYKDELPPRIVVQVKSIEGDISEDRLLALKGAMEPSDYGLFVSLSDYTKNAQDFLEKHHEIRGINGEELSELVIKYYENLDEKYKDMIPLEKVYIPVPRDDR